MEWCGGVEGVTLGLSQWSPLRGVNCDTGFLSITSYGIECLLVYQLV